MPAPEAVQCGGQRMTGLQHVYPSLAYTGVDPLTGQGGAEPHPGVDGVALDVNNSMTWKRVYLLWKLNVQSKVRIILTDRTG